MRKNYDKLIRDKIPDIIRAEGRTCFVESMSEKDYLDALLEKLVEEATEARNADAQHLLTELADLFEVMLSIVAAQGAEWKSIAQIQEARRAERGGFEKRLRLLWVE
jgi:predicted house-cleaning noncanonical NTP pyrophosphatase (MazG superfamily)